MSKIKRVVSRIKKVLLKVQESRRIMKEFGKEMRAKKTKAEKISEIVAPIVSVLASLLCMKLLGYF